MARVLWLGDAGAETGFGRVTHSIGERLVTTHGHDVHVLAVNYRGDYIESPMKLYVPNLRVNHDIYGMSRILEMLDRVKPDVVVILNDPQVVVKMLFNSDWDEGRVLLRHKPIIAYMPVDGTGQPPAWETLGKVTRRVAMTEFGKTAMPEAALAYHGVDTETYHPLSEGPITLSTGVTIRTKKEAKQAFGYDPDGFLVLRVDRNSERKNYPDTIKALWPVLKAYKDIQVHFHCQAIDTMGFNLAQMLSREPDVKDRFFFPDNHDTFKGWAEQDLAALYNAADLFVSTSYGEGFGLTLAEAAASGLPIIAQNVSCIPEVAGPAGVFIEPLRTVTVPSGEDQWMPQVDGFTEAIVRLYNAPGTRRKLGQAGREHVVQSFSWDRTASVFNDLITELAGQRPAGGTA
jgi:glycosyltransferase involved in cell wall biosynthesis